MARKTPEQRLAELERKRATLSERIRAAATREKIVIGAAAAAEAKADPAFADRLKSILQNRVNRAADRDAISQFLASLTGDEPPAAGENADSGDAPPSELAADPLAGISIPRRAAGRHF